MVSTTLLHGFAPRLGVFVMNVRISPHHNKYALQLWPDIDALQSDCPRTHRSIW